jgi:hypothetical protein
LLSSRLSLIGFCIFPLAIQIRDLWRFGCLPRLSSCPSSEPPYLSSLSCFFDPFGGQLFSIFGSQPSFVGDLALSSIQVVSPRFRLKSIVRSFACLLLAASVQSSSTDGYISVGPFTCQCWFFEQNPPAW